MRQQLVDDRFHDRYGTARVMSRRFQAVRRLALADALFPDHPLRDGRAQHGDMTGDSTKILADGGNRRAGLDGVIFAVDEDAQQRWLIGEAHRRQTAYHIGVEKEGTGQLLGADKLGRGWDNDDVGGHQRHFLQLAPTVLALGIDNDDVKVALHPGQHGL